ncbi:MAG: hypothetical protein ACI4B3_10195, partial [Prevotella sp.]
KKHIIDILFPLLCLKCRLICDNDWGCGRPARTSPTRLSYIRQFFRLMVRMVRAGLPHSQSLA